VIWNSGETWYRSHRWTSVGYPTFHFLGSTIKNQYPIVFPGIDIDDVEHDDFGSREIETEDYIQDALVELGLGDHNLAGWSGGPLLGFIDGGWWVGGVMSGQEGDGIDLDGILVFAGGPRLGPVHGEAWTRYKTWSTWTEDMTAAYGYIAKPTSTVAACSWAPDRLDLFWRGTNDHLMHAWWHGGTWSWVQDMTAEFNLQPMASSPTACSDQAGQLDVFWRGGDGHVHHLWWPHTSGNWSWDQDLTASYGYTAIVGAPAAASWAPGRFDVFWLTVDQHIRHAWYPHNDDWSWEQDMTASYGPTLAWSPPVVTDRGAGVLDLFWQSTDGHIRHLWYPHNDDWSWEQDMTASFGHGPTQVKPAACSWGPGRVDLFWRSTQNHLQHAWWPNGADWSGVEDLTLAMGYPLMTSPPTVCSREDRTLDVFFLGNDGHLKHVWY
jgi:hypothetical protein